MKYKEKNRRFFLNFLRYYEGVSSSSLGCFNRFIELYNTGDEAIEIHNYQLTKTRNGQYNLTDNPEDELVCFSIKSYVRKCDVGLEALFKRKNHF